MPPPTPQNRPQHLDGDQFCHCVACWNRYHSVGWSEVQTEYFAREWPRIGFVDINQMALIDCEEMIDREYDEDTEDKHDRL